MSYKKPERRDPTWWRSQRETVSQMQAAKWDVHSACTTCGLRIRLDLELTIKVHGPHLSLWNHRQSCPNLTCYQGVVRFWGRPPELTQPIELSARWPENRDRSGG